MIRGTTLKDIGAVLGPHDAWLVLRGLKTLPVRMERHLQNAERVAQFLQRHPLVRGVRWPGLPSHPGYRLIGPQMKGGGAVISFELNAGFDEAVRFMNALEVFTLAESLGGVESLAGHPATMSHSNVAPERRLELGIPDNLVRLSSGIEDVDDLLADLDQALAVV